MSETQTVDANRFVINVKLGDSLSASIKQVFFEFYLDEIKNEPRSYLFRTTAQTSRWNEEGYVEQTATRLFCSGQGSNSEGYIKWETPTQCTNPNYRLPSTKIKSELPPPTKPAASVVSTSPTRMVVATTPSSTQQVTTTSQTTTTSTPTTSTQSSTTQTINQSTTVVSTTSTIGNTSTTSATSAVTTATTNASASVVTAVTNASSSVANVVTTSTAALTGSLDPMAAAEKNIPGFSAIKGTLPANLSVGQILKTLIATAIPPLIRATLQRGKSESEKLKKQLEAFKEQAKLEKEKLEQSKKNIEAGVKTLTYPLAPKVTPVPEIELPRAVPETEPEVSPTPTPTPTPTIELIKTKKFYFIYEAGDGFKNEGGFDAPMGTGTLEEVEKGVPQSGIYLITNKTNYAFFYNGKWVDSITGPEREVAPEISDAIISNFICNNPEKFGGLQPKCNEPDTSDAAYAVGEGRGGVSKYRLDEGSIEENEDAFKNPTLNSVLIKVVKDTRNAGFNSAVLIIEPGIQGLPAGFNSLSYTVKEQEFQLQSYINTFNAEAEKQKIKSVNTDKSSDGKNITQFTLSRLELTSTPTPTPTPTVNESVTPTPTPIPLPTPTDESRPNPGFFGGYFAYGGPDTTPIELQGMQYKSITNGSVQTVPVNSGGYQTTYPFNFKFKDFPPGTESVIKKLEDDIKNGFFDKFVKPPY